MYLTALISFLTSLALSNEIGSIFFCRRVSLVAASSLRSNLVPTRMMGTFGAWCSISGYHWRSSQSRPIANRRKPYLGCDVVKGRRADDREAHQEDVGLRVGERAQPVVIFLSGRVPEPETDGFTIDHDTRPVVVESA